LRWPGALRRGLEAPWKKGENLDPAKLKMAE
jgi:hypothetical protein